MLQLLMDHMYPIVTDIAYDPSCIHAWFCILYVQHYQAMLDRWVCEPAHSIFHVYLDKYLMHLYKFELVSNFHC